MKFTDDQQKVIDERNTNILVSAAAGSGKTAVLVERIVTLVCDETQPVDIDHLLVVTFTKAAAAEMKERLHKRLGEKLSENPESEHIQRQYTLVHRAQITTIDSFCQNILRNHFHVIGLDPDFRVMDEAEKKLLSVDVLAQLLEEKFEQGDEKFLLCNDFFNKQSKQGALEELILGLQDHADSFPWPKDELEVLRGSYAKQSAEEFLTDDAAKHLIKLIVNMMLDARDMYGRAKELCAEEDGPDHYLPQIETEYEEVCAFCDWALANREALSLREIECRLLEITEGIKTIARTPKNYSKDVGKKELVQKLRDDAKGIIKKKIIDEYFFISLDRMIADTMLCREPVEMLIDLTAEYMERLEVAKREKHLVDFADLEHYALQVLTTEENGKRVPSEIAKEYQQYFEQVMIDEYQDSNQVQEEILTKVVRLDPPNYFMVGDVKQSIYGFRQADPSIFNGKLREYGDAPPNLRINLSANFRSRLEVINSVNAVFQSIMRREVGEIEYDAAAQLYYNAVCYEQENSDCETEVILLDDTLCGDINNKQMSLSEDGTHYPFSSKSAEALAIACKIKELCGEQMVTRSKKDENGQEVFYLEPAKYSDFVILRRSVSTSANIYKQVFEMAGVPLVLPSAAGYYSAKEVADVLEFLRILSNPLQDIPLYGVLLSPFGRFREQDIAKLRSVNTEKTLYETLQIYVALPSANTDPVLVHKANAFLSLVAEFRHKSTYSMVRDLIQELYDRFGYVDYVTALPGGEKRRANVEMLLEKASDYEKTAYVGVYRFVRYIDELEKYEQDFGEADVIDEHANVVRLMTIHKSKGLEFPITIVAGMGTKFADQDLKESLMIDSELGLGCDYVDRNKGIKHKTIRGLAIKAKKKEKSRAEELRVLYVAMTRAREKLILFASVPKADEVAEAIEKGVGASPKLSYQKFIDSTKQFDFLKPVLYFIDLPVHRMRIDDLTVPEQVNLAGRQALSDKLAEVAQYPDAYMDVLLYNAIAERFQFAYPGENLKGLRVKTCVTELKEARMTETEEYADSLYPEVRVPKEVIPAFRKEAKNVSGSERGNAYHRLMEILDYDFVLAPVFGAIPDTYSAYLSAFRDAQVQDGIRRLWEEQVNEGIVSREMVELVNPGKILNFLKNEMAYRIWKAFQRGDLYREQPFVYGLSASRVKAEYPPEETMLIQGIIDLYFVENNQIILVDYKTDALSNIDDIVNKHKLQLDYYSEALEDLTKLFVKESWIYSFHLDCFGQNI